MSAPTETPDTVLWRGRSWHVLEVLDQWDDVVRVLARCGSSSPAVLDVRRDIDGIWRLAGQVRP